MQQNKIRQYDQVITRLFEQIYIPDADILPFIKQDIVRVVRELGLEINNVPDIAYTYRTGRAPLPQAILQYGNWAIDGRGKGKYAFVKLKRSPYVSVPVDLEIISIRVKNYAG